MHKIVKRIIDASVRFIDTAKPVVMILIVIVLILAVVTGHKYYKFTQNDPRFCELCHPMKEPIKSWQKSAHKDVVCQTCHAMSLLAQNSLLLSYIVSGEKSSNAEQHGRLTPWESCNTCHLGEVKQGSVTLRKSYGHARHVFMEQIACSKCHTADAHDFKPDEKNCPLCHRNKGVHGAGMEGFACLSCHAYGDTRVLPKKERCLSCHKDVPAKGSMSKIECRNCHKPHTSILPTAKDCLVNCHANQEEIGRHNKHSHISCLECHKAHAWKVDKEEARSLCSKCHEYEDPFKFVF